MTSSGKVAEVWEGDAIKTIAIVDDSPEDVAVLSQLVRAYFENAGEPCRIVPFSDGLFLLEGYTPIYDLIFLDVEMRLVDGLDGARQLREIDGHVPIVYTTRMAQYAVNGYEVGAVGYLVKPVNQYALRLAMDRALQASRHDVSKTLWVTRGEEQCAVRAADIDYVEVSGHDLRYHCEGDVYHSWGSLKSCEEELAPLGFVRCNRYCIVNLLHVDRLRKETVLVGGDELLVSRRRKKDLHDALVGLYQRRRGHDGSN